MTRQSVTAASTVTDLVNAGLLEVGDGCVIHPTAVFTPADLPGTLRPIVIGERVTIGAFAIIHGGTRLGQDTIVGHRVIIGEPEFGYALREVYPGAGADTIIGAGVHMRAGAMLYAGVSVGDDSTVGHNVMVRTDVTVGSGSQLAANCTIERAARIGDGVRCSAGVHVTAETVLADRVFLGNGVRTINDKRLIWRDPEQEEPLVPPRFEYASKVGAGSIVLAGVQVGQHALVGAGSVVTRDVQAFTVVYGNPARPHAKVTL